jgi:Cu/Zn superoxide dismutase
LITWDLHGLRPFCWTEGHIHYSGDNHGCVLKDWAELENNHMNPYQQYHGVNKFDSEEGKTRHMGDITNLLGDENGNAYY